MEIHGTPASVIYELRELQANMREDAAVLLDKNVFDVPASMTARFTSMVNGELTAVTVIAAVRPDIDDAMYRINWMAAIVAHGLGLNITAETIRSLTDFLAAHRQRQHRFIRLPSGGFGTITTQLYNR